MKPHRAQEAAVAQVCEWCGSDHVIQEAALRWNVSDQKWTIEVLLDAFCDKCDTKTEVEPIPL